MSSSHSAGSTFAAERKVLQSLMQPSPIRTILQIIKEYKAVRQRKDMSSPHSAGSTYSSPRRQIHSCATHVSYSMRRIHKQVYRALRALACLQRGGGEPAG